ncbi:RNA polymerase sigma factor [Bacillus infantis]|uniref:RNA polymerase sigma factor n=1 Tax=Bacillus TaxID=1386 RepID=UPI001CD20068|nr:MULTISPECIES: RNA polymerase sigma factor [Bacillus]MCA1038402.1 RNA polymerase sigma factor [Bacillus infantis]MDT0163391.1 RNA polymerase sigma factor [Bacillus sp. AG4(2022)]
MKKHNDLSSISKDMEELASSFEYIVQPYRDQLWHYCRKLTGTPWDAEDLLQDTLLKAFSSLSRVGQATNAKSYLFRIATNTWMDHFRKKSPELLDMELERIPDGDIVSYSEVLESVEILIHQLPAKQAAAILLAEVYRFTIRETAEIIGSTEGGVQSLLSRARANLKRQRAVPNLPFQEAMLTDEKKQVIQQYMDYFVRGDFQSIGQLLGEYATNEVIGQGMDIGKTQIRKNSMGDWGGSTAGLSAKLAVLWGRYTVIYTRDAGSGPVLWDIATVEIEEGKLIRHKSYYFCREFLEEAAAELSLKLDTEKDLFGQEWERITDYGKREPF